MGATSDNIPESMEGLPFDPSLVLVMEILSPPGTAVKGSIVGGLEIGYHPGQEASSMEPIPVRPAAGSGAVVAYLSLLSFHVAHILEEILGRFVVLQKLGPVRFAAVNWGLFLIPVVFFYFWLAGRRWARRTSVLYAGLMVLNGVGHNIMTLATGRYLDGYAGGFSGIGLAVSGTILIRSLLRKDPGLPGRT